jgi:hypothetical protein
MTTITSYSNNGRNKSVTRKSANARPSNERRVERLMLRLAAASLLFILLFAGAALMRTDASGDKPAVPTAHERMIVVSAGDTLWTIASGIRKDGEDLRQIVYNLKERNGLRSSILRAGDTLIVPAD